MVFSIRYSEQAKKEDFPFLAPAITERVHAAIEEKLMHDPVRFGKPLRYEWKGARSLRVGDYRIVYDVDLPTKTVKILTVGHRRDIYEH